MHAAAWRPAGCLIVFFTFLLSGAAFAQGIQMLPPVTEATKTTAPPTHCPKGGSANVLTWDGTNPISCATGVTVSGGNVTASGSVTIGTATANVTTVTIANQLASAPVCATTEALTKTATGFVCIAVTDIANVGYSVTIPTCSTTQTLYFNGSAFSCQNLPAAPTPPVCNQGNVLQSDGTNYSCVSLNSLLGCPAGEGLLGPPATPNGGSSSTGDCTWSARCIAGFWYNFYNGGGNCD